MALEFLEVEYVTIQHYGVRGRHAALQRRGAERFRNQAAPSAAPTPASGRSPLIPATSAASGSRTRRQPLARAGLGARGCAWPAVLGREAAAHARRLAAATHRFPDAKRALVELLERWDSGLTASPAERRMAVRLSAGQLRLTGDNVPAGTAAAAGAVSALPSVARIAALSAFTASRRDGQVPLPRRTTAPGSWPPGIWMVMTMRTPSATRRSPARRAPARLMRMTFTPMPGSSR